MNEPLAALQELVSMPKLAGILKDKMPFRLFLKTYICILLQGLLHHEYVYSLQLESVRKTNPKKY